MNMWVSCANWVESLFGAEQPPFTAHFVAGNIGVAATFTLSDVLQLKVSCVGGPPSRGVIPVANAAEAHGRLTTEGSTLAQSNLERLRQDPGWRTAMAKRQKLASAYGVQIMCTYCAGRGRVSCQVCGGSANMTCQICGGRGRRNCSSCGGAGGGMVTVQNAYGWTNQYATCSACGGAGTFGCYCYLGKVPCTNCSGGTISCSACHGTGSRTNIHTAELELSVATDFQVVEAADEFIAKTARAAPDAISTYSRLNAPGQRHPGSRSIGYTGQCEYEDGELALAGRSTRIVAIGAETAAVAATLFLDDACLGFREHLEETAQRDLSALLAFADGNRFAAAQVLKNVERSRPRTLRIGIERRALASQSAAEKALTAVLLSPDFLEACRGAVGASVDRHVAAYRARLRELYKDGFRWFLAVAPLGLPLLRAFWLPPFLPYRTVQAVLVALLAWIGLVALICGMAVIFRVVRMQQAERQRLSERPAAATLLAQDEVVNSPPD